MFFSTADCISLLNTSLTTFAGSPSASTSRCFVDRAYCKISLQCSALMGANCRLYWCTAREAISAAFGTTTAMIAAGFTGVGVNPNVTASQTLYTDLNTTLFMSAQFTAWWKIDRVKNFKLRVNGTKSVTVRCKGRALNKEHIDTSAHFIYPKGARILILQQWGVPATDSASTTHTIVSDTKINLTTTEVYRARAVYMNQQTHSLYNTMPAPVGTAGLLCVPVYDNTFPQHGNISY